MAYADYDFYKYDFLGSTVPDDLFPQMSERASAWIDTLTNDRLAGGLPSDERHQKRIKMAVCELAEVYYQLYLAETQGIAMATADVTGKNVGNISTGIITSVSAGSESVSYATPQQIGSGAQSWSKIYSVVGDRQKTNDLLLKTAMPLLMGVRTDDGIPILYGGL